jgi:hypothetical protein
MNIQEGERQTDGSMRMRGARASKAASSRTSKLPSEKHRQWPPRCCCSGLELMSGGGEDDEVDGAGGEEG